MKIKYLAAELLLVRKCGFLGRNSCENDRSYGNDKEKTVNPSSYKTTDCFLSPERDKVCRGNAFLETILVENYHEPEDSQKKSSEKRNQSAECSTYSEGSGGTLKRY